MECQEGKGLTTNFLSQDTLTGLLSTELKTAQHKSRPPKPREVPLTGSTSHYLLVAAYTATVVAIGVGLAVGGGTAIIQSLREGIVDILLGPAPILEEGSLRQARDQVGLLVHGIQFRTGRQVPITEPKSGQV